MKNNATGTGKAAGSPEATKPVAIITGGAGAGIGHGITSELAAAGWSVLVVDRDEAAARTLIARLRRAGKTAEYLAADITANGIPEQAVEEAMRRFGRLDGLVNNAGVGFCRPIEQITDKEVTSVFSVDYLAAFRFTRAVLPELRKTRGAIVNIGSVHAQFGHASYAIYASAKAALEALTRVTAIESGTHGVRANCVHPGLVDSPQNHALIQQFTNGCAEEWLGTYLETRQCIPQPITPAHVGGLVAYLLSEKAATLTGQSIFLDAGSTIMLFDRDRT